jgi:hypothetical protein
MSPIGTLALCIMAGFVTSKIVANLCLLLMGQKGQLQFKPRSEVGRVLAIGVVTFTGPATLFDHSLTATRTRSQPLPYLWMSLSLVVFWSYLLGLFVVQLALASEII